MTLKQLNLVFFKNSLWVQKVLNQKDVGSKTFFLFIKKIGYGNVSINMLICYKYRVTKKNARILPYHKNCSSMWTMPRTYKLFFSPTQILHTEPFLCNFWSRDISKTKWGFLKYSNVINYFLFLLNYFIFWKMVEMLIIIKLVYQFG